MKGYEACVATRTVRKLLRQLKQSTDLLDFVHSDICEFYQFFTEAWLKYFLKDGTF